MHYVYDGALTPEDKARCPFIYLPFDLPADTLRLNIAYDYSDAMPASDQWGGNTLDLGLFGPGGTDFGSGDFRGWSGSFRPKITIGRDDATPAYIPGLPSGQWHVMLGMYNLSADGCRYQVKIDVLDEDAPSDAATECHPSAAPDLARLSAPAPAGGPRWYRGDLHCHTLHSDGHPTIRQLTDHARSRALDFLCITDHNSVSHHAFLPGLAGPGFLPIGGQEITTYFGHANVWGAPRWMEFRCTTSAEMQRSIDLAHQLGLLVSVNHPKPEGPPWLFGDDLGFDCMEVWQAPWWVYNFESLRLWDSLLRRGRRIVAVGGSDLHAVASDTTTAPYPLGTPTTWVYAGDLTQDGILAGIRAGHVFVGADAHGPRLELTAECRPGWAMMGDTLKAPAGEPVHFHLRAHGANGLILRLVAPTGVVNQVPVERDAATFRFSATPEALGAGRFPQPYLRAELIQPPEADLEVEPAALMVEALTNPIYVRQ
jgi:hypothetical protein